jgi:hypothetical protein
MAFWYGRVLPAPGAKDIGGWPSSTGLVSAWGETDVCANRYHEHPYISNRKGANRVESAEAPTDGRLPSEQFRWPYRRTIQGGTSSCASPRWL